MSITAYWKATTGFNVTDYPVTLGKPVNQCSNAELIAHPLCGSISPYNNVAYSVAVEETIGGNGSRIGYVAGSAGFTYPIITGHSEEWTVGPNPSDDIRKQYRRTIFVACPTNVSLPARCITDQCNSGILIVENITAPNKLVQLFGNTPSSGTYQAFTVNISTACRHTCQRGQSAYSSAPNQIQYTDPETQTTTSYYIYPVWYYEYNNVSYLFREEFHEYFGGVYRAGEPDEHNYNYITCNSTYRASFSTTTPYVLAMGYNPNASSAAKSLIDVVGRSAYADPIPDPAQFSTTPLDFPTFNLAPDGAGVVVGLTMSNSTQSGYRVCTLNMQLWAGNEWYRAPAFCRAGTYFVNNGELLKPIIKDGIVTGYGLTDEDSEIDDYTDLNHPVPSGPGGGGGGGGGYDDDPWHGISFSGVGVGGAGAFAKCELANLRSWMNSNNVPEGFDPMAQIIGLSQVPVSLSGDDNTTVQFVNSSAVYDPGVTRLVDSGVSTQISMGSPKRYSLGSVNITRRMQERGEPYLDYDCQIELYLPLIGMFSLDTQAVMGRTITAEAVLDPISGTLAAYAYVTRDGQNLPIAYGSTTIGVDLPISAQQYSVSRAALKQANAQLGTSLLSSTLSFIAAATAGGKGSGTGAKTATGSTNGLAAAGIREAGADYMKASQAGNVFGDFMQWGRTIRQLSYGNNTAIAGSFGGSTAQWSYPFTPYVKIMRPRYEKPSNYNHSQGVPCVQAKTVGSCTGFIQCIGVDVSGITGATDIELQAIQAALTNGVFAGGGS